MVRLDDGEKVPNRRIDDLCDIWAKHNSLAAQMWTILIKRYQDMGEWEVKFEKTVMQTLHMEYVEEEE